MLYSLPKKLKNEYGARSSSRRPKKEFDRKELKRRPADRLPLRTMIDLKIRYSIEWKKKSEKNRMNIWLISICCEWKSYIRRNSPNKVVKRACLDHLNSLSGTHKRKTCRNNGIVMVLQLLSGKGTECAHLRWIRDSVQRKTITELIIGIINNIIPYFLPFEGASSALQSRYFSIQVPCRMTSITTPASMQENSKSTLSGSPTYSHIFPILQAQHGWLALYTTFLTVYSPFGPINSSLDISPIVS